MFWHFLATSRELILLLVVTVPRVRKDLLECISVTPASVDNEGLAGGERRFVAGKIQGEGGNF
jgi:hypothetical protein